MAYITSRKDRFYVVAYDGHDPLTGRERRKWHPAGRSRADAEAIMATLNDTKTVQTAELAKPTTLAAFLTDIWLPCRRGQLQPTTARRYAWIVENYIKPRIGYLALRNVRTEHLDALYLELLKCGGQDGDALAPKTVYDVHVMVRSGLGDAVRRHYLTNNVATSARPPRPQARARSGPDSWTTDQLRRYLDSVRQLRLSPAIHLAATTGMRRGEVAGLRWGDWQPRTRRLSIARARQVVGGRSMEVPCKTRSSRRCVDLDKRTDAVLAAWRQTPTARRPPHRLRRPDIHQHLRSAVAPGITHPTIHRHIARAGVPRIRFHDYADIRVMPMSIEPT